MIDVPALRAHFPALAPGSGRPVAHFDGPGGSQVPDVVAAAVTGTLTAGIANRGRVTAAERVADDTVLAARAAMADLLGGEAGGVVFGRSMTALTFDLARTLAATWSPGDEIVVTRLDHDANIRPWVLAAERAGVTVRWAEFDADSAELASGAIETVADEPGEEAVPHASDEPDPPTTPAPAAPSRPRRDRSTPLGSRSCWPRSGSGSPCGRPSRGCTTSAPRSRCRSA